MLFSFALPVNKSRSYHDNKTFAKNDFLKLPNQSHGSLWFIEHLVFREVQSLTMLCIMALS
jgi:hypothetical protein